MGVLDQPTRSQLLATLSEIPVLDTANGRSVLLQDLPPALVGTIRRDEAKAVDLANIVYACDAWSADALRTVIAAARDLVKGSGPAAQLQAVLDALATAQAVPSPVDLKLRPLLSSQPSGDTTVRAAPGSGLVHTDTHWEAYARAFIMVCILAVALEYLGSILITSYNSSNYQDLWINHLLEPRPDLENVPYWILSSVMALVPTLVAVYILYKQLIWYAIGLMLIGAFVGEIVYRFLARSFYWDSDFYAVHPPPTTIGELGLHILSGLLISICMFAVFYLIHGNNLSAIPGNIDRNTPQ